MSFLIEAASSAVLIFSHLLFLLCPSTIDTSKNRSVLAVFGKGEIDIRRTSSMENAARRCQKKEEEGKVMHDDTPSREFPNRAYLGGDLPEAFQPEKKGHGRDIDPNTRRQNIIKIVTTHHLPIVASRILFR